MPNERSMADLSDLPLVYQIRIKGHLPPHWTDWLVWLALYSLASVGIVAPFLDLVVQRLYLRFDLSGALLNTTSNAIV